MIFDAGALRATLTARPRISFDVPGHRRAAVLVPLFERSGVLATVLTLRSAALRNHSGQWSFPGGGTDDNDAHAMATAIREAHEEIGLSPESVTVLGLLDDVPTPSGYTITPVVGHVVPAPERYLPSAAEVAEILELPLAQLGTPIDRGRVERWGHSFRMVAFDVDGRNVWGATARILDELVSVLR